MTEPEMQALSQENLYLKRRIAQLEGDVADLAAESGRLRQMLERISARRPGGAPNPLGGGQ